MNIPDSRAWLAAVLAAALCGTALWAAPPVIWHQHAFDDFEAVLDTYRCVAVEHGDLMAALGQLLDHIAAEKSGAAENNDLFGFAVRHVRSPLEMVYQMSDGAAPHGEDAFFRRSARMRRAIQIGKG